MASGSFAAAGTQKVATLFSSDCLALLVPSVNETKETLKGGTDTLSNLVYSEVLADLPGKEVADLLMSWDRRSFVQFRIPPP